MSLGNKINNMDNNILTMAIQTGLVSVKINNKKAFSVILHSQGGLLITKLELGNQKLFYSPITEPVPFYAFTTALKIRNDHTLYSLNTNI